MAFVLFALRHACLLVVLTIVVWAAGTLVGRLLRRRAMAWPMTFAIGLALLSQLALLLGLVGWLRASSVVIVVAILTVVGVGWCWRRDAIAWSVSAGLAVVAVAVLAVPLFLLALYPPIGFDQTLYHLPYARAYAASGGVPFLPELRYPAFPVLAEVLNAAVLLVADDVATQLVGGVALVACLGLVFAWTVDLVEDEHGAWIAVAMLAGSPIALYLSTAGYVEPMLALFGLGALYAADRAGRVEGGGRVARIVVAGALAGSAAGVKYLGLLFVPAAALLLVWRPRRTWAARDLGWFAMAALLALAPSYGRLIAQTGNPLFPFYPDLFGANPWQAQEFLGKRGVAHLVAASTLLWDITFRRHAVGGLPFYSPAFAIALPLILIAAWREVRLRPLLAIAIGYVVTAPTHAHYFLAIAPLWTVLAGAASVRLFGRWPRALTVAAVVLALGGEAYAIHRVYRLGLPPATVEGRDRLIASQRPLYPAVSFVNRTAGTAVVYGVHAEEMVYYASGRWLGDHNGPASYTRVGARADTLGSFAAALDEIGAAYAIVANADAPWIARADRDPRLALVYRDAYASVYHVSP